MLKKRGISNTVQIISLSFLVLGMALVSGTSHARNGLAAASGHGNLVMDGALRTFSFQAREFKNGEVQGSLVLKNRHLGVRVRADINCLRIIDGDEAILSGELTQVDGVEENLIGDEIWFRVHDNGEGRGDPADQVTELIVLEVEIDPSEMFLCKRSLKDISDIISGDPDIEGALDLQDIIGGNVQVRE